MTVYWQHFKCTCIPKCIQKRGKIQFCQYAIIAISLCENFKEYGNMTSRIISLQFLLTTVTRNLSYIYMYKGLLMLLQYGQLMSRKQDST